MYCTALCSAVLHLYITKPMFQKTSKHAPTFSSVVTPYESLYSRFMMALLKVILHSSKHFKVDLRIRTDSISIDRLKCAHIDHQIAIPTSLKALKPENSTTTKTTTEELNVRKTRSDRHVHFPERYVSIVYR